MLVTCLVKPGIPIALTKFMMNANTQQLEAMYARAGLPCAIDASPFGLVVYGSSAVGVRAVCRGLANAPLSMGVPVTMTDPAEEKDEEPETRFWARVDFDWDQIG